MNRRAILTVYQRLKALNLSQNTKVISTPCKHTQYVPVFRATEQVSRRAFSSSGVHLCEKKEGEKTGDVQEVKKSQSTGADREQRSKDSETKQAAALNTEATSEIKPESVTSPDLKTEAKPEAVGQESVTTESAHKTEENEKTGKKGLLELLGAMKVEVTTKRKLKSPKSQRSGQESSPRPGEMESTTSMFQQASQAKALSEGVSAEMEAAVSAVASALPDSSQAKSELLHQLRKHEAVSHQERPAERQELGNIIADMKVGKRLNGRQNTRPANQIRFDDDGRGYTHDRGITGELDGVRRRKNPFLAKRVNIFPAGAEQTETDLAAGVTLWDSDLADQMVQVLNQQPRNSFEEMIQWTRDGKMWTYPINNEAGLEEEAAVPFHEHVFLQRHLEEGFPQNTHVTHFMELVLTGLAKNHQLTVSQKLEHISWFREYFQQKQDVLKEAEAY